jgi:Domain of unknown function (DUF4352)
MRLSVSSSHVPRIAVVAATMVVLIGAWAAPARAATPTPPVRDGKFEFVVESISCGHSHVGDSIMGDAAQGQFCLVKMSVKNIGNEAQTFDDTSQYAFDASNKKFSADSEADLDINSDAWMADINPGNKITGKLAYDIPKGDKIVKMELHDSMFSGGVTVNVS